MSNSRKQKCSTCRHFHPNGGKGECRKYAPQAISPATASPSNKEGTYWPQVQPDDYCDEWAEEEKGPMTSEQKETYQRILKKATEKKDPNMGLLDIK